MKQKKEQFIAKLMDLQYDEKTVREILELKIISTPDEKLVN